MNDEITFFNEIHFLRSWCQNSSEPFSKYYTALIPLTQERLIEHFRYISSLELLPNEALKGTVLNPVPSTVELTCYN
jgi:hypothetical protein